ncbi:MAG: hypothetical protein WCC37_10880, partial [Candidatus Sulfotelmatobacter sp.]
MKSTAQQPGQIPILDLGHHGVGSEKRAEVDLIAHAVFLRAVPIAAPAMAPTLVHDRQSHKSDGIPPIVKPGREFQRGIAQCLIGNAHPFVGQQARPVLAGPDRGPVDVGRYERLLLRSQPADALSCHAEPAVRAVTATYATVAPGGTWIT